MGREVTELKFFQPDGETRITRHRLTHWQQGGCSCAITFRLADSLPGHLLDAWMREREDWRHHHPEPWTDEVEDEYHQRFTRRVQEWLDAGHGSCVLRDTRAARLLAARLDADRAGPGYRLHAFVIMPNHVHVLVSLDEQDKMPEMVRRWKGGSARDINLALGLRGRLWQPDYFDRLVRTPEHFGRCLDYIRANPVKARLAEGEFMAWEDPAVRTLLEEYVAKHGAI